MINRDTIMLIYLELWNGLFKKFILVNPFSKIHF